ncbi:MAG: nuclear transport factor 2 family protein [Hyphomicrobiaceae bacterium]|nr:nuclear transport factor 2 family protein [Hyphomicrobiaceae bacterium]
MSGQDHGRAEEVVTAFIGAFGKADYGRMGGLLADDVESYVTNAEGGSTLLRGRDAYMAAIASVDYRSVGPRIEITQMLSVKPDQVLVMVEIRAERKGRKLHNFAAFLMDVREGKIRTMRMVEALPAYSDAFWKD